MHSWQQVVIIAAPKNIHFDSPKNSNDSLKHENDYIIKYNVFLECKIKIKCKISWLFSKYKNGNDI